MAAITVPDTAIQTVNTQRSKLGAVSNRLTHTVNNLSNISANLSAARGGCQRRTKIAPNAGEKVHHLAGSGRSKTAPACWV